MESHQILTIIIGIIMVAIFGGIVAYFIRVSRKEDDEMSEDVKEQRRQEAIRTKGRVLRGLVIAICFIAVLGGWGIAKALLYSPGVPNRWWMIAGLCICELLVLALSNWILNKINRKYNK